MPTLYRVFAQIFTSNYTSSTFSYPVLFGSRCNSFPTKIISLMMLVCLFSGVAMLPFVPLPGAIAAKLTMEKESKMKLLLLVLGMSPHYFWCAAHTHSLTRRPTDRQFSLI